MTVANCPSSAVSLKITYRKNIVVTQDRLPRRTHLIYGNATTVHLPRILLTCQLDVTTLSGDYMETATLLHLFALLVVQSTKPPQPICI